MVDSLIESLARLNLFFDKKSILCYYLVNLSVLYESGVN